MSEINVSECSYTIIIGDAIRRSLIKHFDSFLREQLRLIGADPDDDQLCKQDHIEQRAWLLADKFIADMRFYADDVGDVTARHSSAAEVLRSYVDEELPAFKEEFLADPMEWQLFLTFVTGEPQWLAGVPHRRTTG